MFFSDQKAKGSGDQPEKTPNLENYLHNLKSTYCHCTRPSPRESVLQQVEWNVVSQTQNYCTVVSLPQRNKTRKSQTKPRIWKIPPNCQEKLLVPELSAQATRAESAVPGVLKTSRQSSRISSYNPVSCSCCQDCFFFCAWSLFFRTCFKLFTYCFNDTSSLQVLQ